MYTCKNGTKILNDLPLWKGGWRNGKIDSKSMVGMSLDIEYNNKVYNGINILEYIKEREPKFLIEYNGIKKEMYCSNFLNGNIRKLLNISNNTFEIKDDIVYIHGQSETYGEWTALYSGDYAEYVTSNTWSINAHGYIANVKNKGLLHKLDFKDLQGNLIIDHINNNRLDCRKENLRITDKKEKSKNKNTNNKWGMAGVSKVNNGYYCTFRYEGNDLHTKFKNDLEEVKLDSLIAQRYLGYKHDEELFYLLDTLPQERIKEVEDLLEVRIENNKDKQYTNKEYEYDIEQHEEYYIIHKNNNQTLLDCNKEFFKNKYIAYDNKYWNISFIENNKRITNTLHRELLEIRYGEYKDYNIQVDHLNNNSSDNRYCNLVITTRYSNLCNKKGRGYNKTKQESYKVEYMRDYKYFDKLIGGIKVPTFKTEQEAIQEVERRRCIINNARVKLKNKAELDELIKYCLDNRYTQENGLADLDLGYLYWRNILE